MHGYQLYYPERHPEGFWRSFLYSPNTAIQLFHQQEYSEDQNSDSHVTA
jgi:hypothetical protein